jgi:hypothetical protein
MTSTLKLFLLCPIPENQKPINEYIELKENFFINWTTFTNSNYVKKFFSIYFFWFLLVFLFNFDLTQKNFVSTTLWSILISLNFQVVMTFFFFLRWKDIKKRFNQARIFYEESSWFDGQIWDKPFFLIKNDKLIASQKIEPILQRLFFTLILTILIIFLFLFCCFPFL